MNPSPVPLDFFGGFIWFRPAGLQFYRGIIFNSGEFAIIADHFADPQKKLLSPLRDIIADNVAYSFSFKNVADHAHSIKVYEQKQ